MSGTLEVADGRRIAVVDGLTIGRVPPCGLVLDDTKVSRQHARLVVAGGVVEVEDLGSRNGILLNEQRVQRRMLRDGDVLTVGTTQMVFREEGRPAPVEVAAVVDDIDELSFDEPEPEIEPVRPSRVERAPIEVPQVEVRKPAPAAADVDVIEFVDEVIEVRPRTQPEQPAASGPSPAGIGQRATTGVGRGDHGVLQFSKKEGGGLMKDDLGQMGGLPKLLVVVVAIALAVGIAYAAYSFTA